MAKLLVSRGFDVTKQTNLFDDVENEKDKKIYVQKVWKIEFNPDSDSDSE